MDTRSVKKSSLLRGCGKNVIETLLTFLADTSMNDWMLILAGYPDKMMKMFEMNPGFKSRIPESNIYTFEDFSEAELVAIAHNYFKKKQYFLTDEADDALRRRIAFDYLNRDSSFGNARYVQNLIQTEIIPTMASRVVNEPFINEKSLQCILPEDIPQPCGHFTMKKRMPIGYVG